MFRLLVTDGDGNSHQWRRNFEDADEAAAHIKEASAEFKGCDVVVQELVDNGDETATWTNVEGDS